jgi:uncharacterized protein
LTYFLIGYEMTALRSTYQQAERVAHMSEQDNTQVVQQAYENFKTGNIAALLEQMADDVTWQLPEVEHVPFAGRRQGRAAVEQFFAKLAEVQDPRSFEPQEYVAQGEKVVALGHYVWQVKANGRTYASDWAHVFTIRNGRIAGFHEYMDTAPMAAAYRQD